MILKTQIITLKLTLSGVSPPVWCRIEAPSNVTLFRLAAILQTAMGWKGYHLHQFRIGKEDYGIPDDEFPDEPEMHDERDVRLDEILKSGLMRFRFDYDFGDGWEHIVEVVKISEPEKDVKYPRVTAGARQCSPEDCGGPFGYENFLKAIRDRKHPEHKTMIEWIGGDFDSEEFDLEAFDDLAAEAKVMEKEWKMMF